MDKNWLTATPFAHRGLHGGPENLVENSRSAFRAANAQGHGFELDVLLSQDHQPMVFHDISLQRLTGKNGQLDDYTATQLRTIKLTGSEDSILPLSDILDAIDQNLPILVEIKGDQQQPKVIAKAVHQVISDYPGPIAVMSFYPEIVEYFQDHARHIPRGLVATSLNDGGLPEECFSVDEQRFQIKNLTVDFIAYDISALPNEVTEYCQARAIPVLTWTVRTAEQYEKARKYTDNIIYERVR